MNAETVRRVARAIYAVDTKYDHHDWNNLKQQERVVFTSMAWAAIEEINKPIICSYGLQLR